MAAEGSRTLSREVTDAFRIVITCALAMVAVITATLGWFVFVGGPHIDRSAKLVGLSRNMSASLLEEQSMLRAYVVSGDPSILTTYPEVRDRIAFDRQRLTDLAGNGHAALLVEQLEAATDAWQQSWGQQAALPATRDSFIDHLSGDLRSGQVSLFLDKGAPAFAKAQDAANNLIDNSISAQGTARDEAVITVLSTAALLLLIGSGTAVATLRRRRIMQARVVGPIGVLLAKVQAVGRGEFGVSPVLDAPPEILALRDELADMSASLKLQRQVLASRADEAAASARRMELVVEFAREISDSLTLSNVLSAVTSAGRRLVESPRSRVWLYDENTRALKLSYDSITGDIVPDVTHQVGDGVLGRVAQGQRIAYSGGLTGDTAASSKSLAVAVPLLKGTNLVGVLEIALQPGASWLDADTVDVLTATAGQAATAIHAAQLYALAESLSRSDSLTGLANRRQLDIDLDLEVERAIRYNRPLSFLMIDIDHFKAVNDTFGHSLGDSVLTEVAELIADEMRSGDTAYRYGGEEFAILARESDGIGGRAIAERLRKAVEARYAALHSGDVAVTISIGLVTVRSEVDSAPQLIAAADRALYDAKRSGRNCVRVAAIRTAEAEGDARLRILH